MAAALTLATACSKEEDNNIVPQPLLEAETTQPAVVKVPFSVKVDNGTQSLKKIKCEPKQDFSEMTFAFEDKDVEETQYILRVYDENHEYLPDDYQYLSLTKISKDEFVFDGELDVIEGKEESFANGDCNLYAELDTYSHFQNVMNKTGNIPGGVGTSIEPRFIFQHSSLENALDFRSFFKSNDETIQLELFNDDETFLFVDGVSDGFSLEYKFWGRTYTESNCSLTNGNWFSFLGLGENQELTITYTENGTTQTTTKTIKPGHLYIFDKSSKQ